MSRQVTIPETIVIEEIGNAAHYTNDSVHFTVGKGTIKDGKFEFTVPQNFDQFVLRDTLYNDLISTYGQGFSNEDLWNYVDIIRSGATDTRPSPNWDWDQANTMWVQNKPRARASKKAEIEKNMFAATLSPISYDNKLLDADALAVSRIHGKLAELSAAEALGATPSPMMWRDANNINHTWPTLADYKVWLQGLVLAISARATAVFITSTQLKDVLATITDFIDIETYDCAVN